MNLNEMETLQVKEPPRTEDEFEREINIKISQHILRFGFNYNRDEARKSIREIVNFARSQP